MKRPDATSAARTSSALKPRARRSRPIWPNCGSVMFWLAIAPTMGRACTQRAATAGEEEEIAIPNMPVLVQRAVREKVMPPSQRSSGITAMASISTSHSGRASAEPPADRAIDRLAVARIDDVDRDLADVFQLCSGLFEKRLDVGHRLFGLASRIADRNAFRAVEVLADLAPNEHHAAFRYHGLAQIVIEALFGIGVLGIEFPDAGVSHAQWSLLEVQAK